MIFADHLEHHLPNSNTSQSAKYANEIIEKTFTIVSIKSQLNLLIIIPEKREFHQSLTTNSLIAKGLQLATGCKKIHMRLKNNQDSIKKFIHKNYLYKIIVHAVGTRTNLAKLEQLLMVESSVNLSEGNEFTELRKIIQNVIRNLEEISKKHQII